MLFLGFSTRNSWRLGRFPGWHGNHRIFKSRSQFFTFPYRRRCCLRTYCFRQHSTIVNVKKHWILPSIDYDVCLFSKNRHLGETVANTLLLGTAAIFLLTSLVSLKFQFHVSKLLANPNIQGTDSVDNTDDAASVSLTSGLYCTSPSFQQSSEPVQIDALENTCRSTLLPTNEHVTQRKSNHHRQIVEVSTLVAFQILLAVSALQKPITTISSQTIWISLVAIFSIIVIITISFGYRYERQSMIDSFSSEEDDRKLHSQTRRLSHKRINLYFLLRYSLPIASFLMYSYIYSAFEVEPIFLQLLSVLQTAIGSVATFCYEKFLSPYCHSGWRLIGLIASLDIITGFVALLDVWVIHTVKEKEVDEEYYVDNQLRYLVLAAGIAKYFFAELDYMPALVLSTTNVCCDKEVRLEYEDDNESSSQTSHNIIDVQLGERVSLSEDFARPNVSALNIDLNNEEDCNIVKSSIPKLPMISSGMQYASFLSCIDFGAQIGDWITVPIVASLGITRENHWDRLDKLVIICSILRMTRVVFLCLIFPPKEPKIQGDYHRP